MEKTIIGVDISSLPDQSVEILVGCEPKAKCKNKYLQKIFIKMFGYKPVYKTRMAKVVTTKTEDCPKGWDGNMTFTFEGKKGSK